MRTPRSALALLLLGAGCSAATSGGGSMQTTAGSAGQGGSGFMIDLNGGSGGGANEPPAYLTALPLPWQYYQDAMSRGFKDTSLGVDVRHLFKGPASASGAPQLVYPVHGAMHAVNEGKITFQWLRGAATNVLFRIDGVGADGKTSSFYVPCAAGSEQCSYAMPKSDWLWLAYENANAKVSFTISGTDGAGGPVATSNAVGAAFSPEPVYGALYYWATGSESIKRASFGADIAVDYIAPKTDANNFGCVGCHAVSRSGKVISFGVAAKDQSAVLGAGIQSAPVEKPSQPYVRPKLGKSPFAAADVGGNVDNMPMDHLGHTVALSPDGQLSVVNGIPPKSVTATDWSWIELRNTTTGATIKHYDIGEPPFGDNVLPIHPEFSPDGSSLAVVLSTNDPNGCLWSYVTCNGPLAVIPIDGNGFGLPRVVAVNSDPNYYNYYPTWSPDGKWIAFQSARRSIDPATGKVSSKSLRNPNGLLRLVRADGGPYTCPGPDCIELTNGAQYTPAQAEAGAGKHTTWPKFTPFAQGKDKNIMFLSVTSQMDYGFLAQGKSQIWMFAIDVSLVGKQDPSFAPVWLPYQQFTDGSLTPYWTETLPCTADTNGACSGCSGGETCSIKKDASCECRGKVK